MAFMPYITRYRSGPRGPLRRFARPGERYREATLQSYLSDANTSEGEDIEQRERPDRIPLFAEEE